MNYLAKTLIALTLALPVSAQAGDPFMDQNVRQIKGPAAEIIGLFGIMPEPSIRKNVMNQPVCTIVAEAEDAIGQVDYAEFACIDRVVAVERDEITNLAVVIDYELGQKYATGIDGVSALHEAERIDAQLLDIFLKRIKPDLARVRPRDRSVGRLEEQVRDRLQVLLRQTGFSRLVQQRAALGAQALAARIEQREDTTDTDLTSGGPIEPKEPAGSRIIMEGVIEDGAIEEDGLWGRPSPD